MESKAVDEEVHNQAESTDSMNSLHTNEESNTASLPSPPSSVKATESDSGRKENGPHSGEIPGGGLSVSRSSADFNGGAGVLKDGTSGGQSSDDRGRDGTNSQEKDESSGKKHDTRMRDIDNEDNPNDSDFESEALREIVYATQELVSIEPLQERIKKAPRRALQQMAYTRLMEDRMRDLEDRLRTIESKTESAAPPSAQINRPSNLILGIKRMSFQEYLPTDPKSGFSDQVVPSGHHRRHEIPGQLPYHLIDIVVSAIHQPERPGKDQKFMPAAGPTDIVGSRLAIPAQEPTTGDGQFLQPDRIRINSTLLLESLQIITGCTFTLSKAPIGDELELQDQVILRPFKLLTTFEKEIRDEIERLERMHSGKREAKASEEAQSEEQNSRSLPITDLMSNVPEESSRQDGSIVIEDTKSKNITTDASVDGENVRKPSLNSIRCLEELRVLRELLDKDLKPTFDLRKHIKDGVARSIAFQDLWHLFPLGEEIVSNNTNGHNQVYRTLTVSGGRSFLCERSEAAMGRSSRRDLPKFDILSYYYGFDGKDFGSCQHLHTIKSYDGNKAITSLPCFPINYSKNSQELNPRDSFIQRGKRFSELTRGTDVVHKRYDGLTLAMDGIREQIDSEVIIDVNMAVLKNNVDITFGITSELERDPRETLEFPDPRCRRQGCCQNTPIHPDYHIDTTQHLKRLEEKGFMHDFIEADNELTEEDYLVCPCWVYGYVLRSRKWVKLDVSLVEDLKERGNGFDSLVLPDGHKETLLALVQTHSKGMKLESGLKAENRQMDLVRGKGKGLIILLHGEPGVGKSSTAESVAEFTHRPLFQVTCGDIGESADEVERRLENHFQLAHKWGCVLLLDEADVFLEARSKTDLKRNAIVSVFLRVLEYYSGILFLTTNRVGAFDQAFRSRIHMSLFYPKIDQDATIKIWEMNIDRAREIWGDKLSIDEPDRKGILKFASKHYKELAQSETTWNGRQIRNAFQTAIALAEWEAYQSQLKFKSPNALKPVLEPKHFESVAKASKHFDAYLKETQVGTVADLAMQNRERRDDFRE